MVFDDENFKTKMLVYLIKLTGEERDIGNNTVKTSLQLHAQNVSGFDTWIIANSLPCNRRLGDMIKNGKGIISSKVFIGYVQNNKKQIPQYPIFICGMTYSNFPLGKMGKNFELQKELWKKYLNYKEVYANRWRDTKHEWIDYIKNDL